MMLGITAQVKEAGIAWDKGDTDVASRGQWTSAGMSTHRHVWPPLLPSHTS